jgi:signal transduction histidine kinase
MNTLFAKILLWFGITLAVMFVGLSVVTALQWRDAPQRSGFAEFHMKQALSALETGGKEGLQEYLKSLGNATNNDVFLLDTGNRDLVTGEVREVPEMRSRRSGPRLFPYFSSGPPRARIIQQGNFRMLMIFREDPGIVWWLTPQSFWILGAAILLCFILAAYLSSPLRAMQRVVEQYGEGKLDLRIRSRRKDEFGKLARAFDQMADRIQTLLGAERRLLADISHELRSPLARLSVATELLEDPEEREIARAQIRRETERLNQLIGGLLEVTRAEGDPSHLRHDTVNLHSLFLDIVHDCSFEARERQVEIRYATEKEWRVEGDPELLRRAVENALRNALRYAPSGSAVSLDCKSSDEGLLIEVRDFGPGVPEEELERIFDPFFRVENDRNRRQGGAGLGLSIARRAVELHGGHIRARNGRPGLLVQIRLPLSVAAPAIV